MKLIRFLYNLIYKAFTSDLSTCKSKAVYSEAKEEIVKREIQEGVVEGIKEVGDGIDREVVPGSGNHHNHKRDNRGRFILDDNKKTYGELTRDTSFPLSFKSGVYQIVNLIDDSKRYIGSSTNLGKRFSGHRADLRTGVHGNPIMQNAFIKYGGENFIFEVIELCNKEDIIKREQYWMDYYGFDNLYNIMPNAENNTGFYHSQETIDKIKLTKAINGKPVWNKGKKGYKRTFNPNSMPETKDFAFVAPNNTLFIGNNIRAFSKAMNLSESGFSKLISGKRKCKSFKGWRLPNPKIKYTKTINWHNGMSIDEIPTESIKLERFELLAPDNKTVFIGEILKDFAAYANLSVSRLRRVLYSKDPVYYGWTKPGQITSYKTVLYENGKEYDIPTNKTLYKIVSPDNILHISYDRLVLANGTELRHSGLCRVLKGTRKQYIGWKLPQKDIEYPQVINWDNQKQESK